MLHCLTKEKSYGEEFVKLWYTKVFFSVQLSIKSQE